MSLRTSLLLCLLAAPALAGVRINEFMAAPSDRQLTWDANGQPVLGSGVPWSSAGLNDAPWEAGNLPAGFAAGGLGTDLTSSMLGKTPVLYLRKTFTVTAADAAGAQPLSLLVESDDGFICWVNGREVARSAMGPAKHFVFSDQPAYVPETRAGLQEYFVGNANTLLIEGENLIAIQAANSNTPPTATNQSWGGQTATFKINAGLRFVGPTVNVTAKSLDFNNAAGASLTHTNNAGSVTNTPAGANAPGGWLATMAANPASTATGSLTAALAENATAGIGAGGGFRMSLTQSGGVTAFTTFGPPIAMTGAWQPGGVNANALAGDPKRSDSALILPRALIVDVADTGHLAIEFRAPASLPAGIIEPQISGDLAFWSNALAFESSTPNPDGTLTLRHRGTLPMSASPRSYMRVHVTVP